MRRRRKAKRIAVLSILALLGLALFAPKPTWWIVERDLGISVSLRKATVEVDTDWKRAPNGDGQDVVRLALDEALWERVILNLDEESWRQEPVPAELQRQMIRDFSERAVALGLEIKNAMDEEGAYWFYRKQRTMERQDGANRMEPSDNYTFALLSPGKRLMYYADYDT